MPMMAAVTSPVARPPTAILLAETLALQAIPFSDLLIGEDGSELLAHLTAHLLSHCLPLGPVILDNCFNGRLLFLRQSEAIGHSLCHHLGTGIVGISLRCPVSRAATTPGSGRQNRSRYETRGDQCS